MDKNDVSFQMFLILLSFITLGSESQILCSSNVKAIPSNLYFFGGGSMHRSQNLEIFSVKKELHKALRSVQFLASFISFYFEILFYLA